MERYRQRLIGKVSKVSMSEISLATLNDLIDKGQRFVVDMEEHEEEDTYGDN